MKNLIKEYIESEYPKIEVSNLYELNNKYDGSTLTYLVTGIDRHGFEISEETIQDVMAQYGGDVKN